MDCSSALERLSQRLDETLDATAEAELDAHLAVCAECRAAGEPLRHLDGLLRTGLSQPAVADRIAAAVIEDLQTPVAIIRPTSTRRGWGAILAVGSSLTAVVAIIVTAWPDRDALATKIAVSHSSNGTEVRPAQFDVTLVKGTIEVRRPDMTEWVPLAYTENEHSVGCELRTASDGMCEFNCPSGGIVRLDTDSEVCLSGQNEISVRRGRLWCQAPMREPLRVVASIQDPLAGSMIAALTCPAASCAQTELTDAPAISVFASQGTVDVVAGNEDVRLPRGTVLTMTLDEHQTEHSRDPLLETSWMTSLLALRGAGDEEFQRHVSSLLSQLGAQKISYLYEQQLLELGEPGAIPLIEFLRAKPPDATAEQRQVAARIIRETAPAESIPDLIQLLEDTDAEVRIAAAEALRRLTGLPHGVDPQEWKNQGEPQKKAVQEWRDWLKNSGDSA